MEREFLALVARLHFPLLVFSCRSSWFSFCFWCSVGLQALALKFGAPWVQILGCAVALSLEAMLNLGPICGLFILSVSVLCGGLLRGGNCICLALPVDVPLPQCGGHVIFRMRIGAPVSVCGGSPGFCTGYRRWIGGHVSIFRCVLGRSPPEVPGVRVIWGPFEFKDVILGAFSGLHVNFGGLLWPPVEFSDVVFCLQSSSGT